VACVFLRSYQRFEDKQLAANLLGTPGASDRGQGDDEAPMIRVDGRESTGSINGFGR
jgi:hypothetical protein